MLLNTPTEIGMRCLFLLQDVYPKSYNIEKIMYLDYLAIYSRDSQMVDDSLHPEHPMRSIELFSKQELFREALLLIASKRLVDVIYDEMGITYKANINTRWFLSGIENNYSIELVKKIKIINEKFKDMPEQSIRKFIEYNIEKWDQEMEHFFI